MSTLSPETLKIVRDAMYEAATRIVFGAKEFSYMPALRPAPPPMLSEQQGWAIYTHAQNNWKNQEANMLVHLACNRHWPNWWLAPGTPGAAAEDPGIECPDCKVKLPLDAYYVFWGAFRLLNMKRGENG